MKHLNFKSWMINELANYGYGYAQSDKSSILGGTEEIEGDEVFFPLKSDEISLWIGPEGDFTQAEADMAMEAGSRPLYLCNNILRTETACLVACSVHYL